MRASHQGRNSDRPDRTVAIDSLGAFRAVVFCAVGLLVTLTPVYMATFPVLLKAMQPDFGNQRTGLTLGYSLLMGSLALTGPFAGRLVDRLGHRWVLQIGVPALAAVIALFAVIPASLPIYIAVCVLAGVVGALTYQFVYYSILPHWFEKRLGLALGLAGTGVSLGMALMPVYADVLLRNLGWRTTYLALAATVLLVGLANLLTLRDPPPAVEHDVGKEKPVSLDGMMLSAVLRNPFFWQLALSYFLLCVMVNGYVIHLVAMLTDRGISTSSAAGSMVVLGIFSLVGRLGSGLLLLRSGLNASRLGAVIFMLGTGGGAMLISANELFMIASAVALIGLALGVEGELLNFMARRLFGLRAHAAVLGVLSAAFLLGALAGPLALSIVYDITGDYLPMQFALVAAGALAAVLHFFVPFRDLTLQAGAPPTSRQRLRR